MIGYGIDIAMRWGDQQCGARCNTRVPREQTDCAFPMASIVSLVAVLARDNSEQRGYFSHPTRMYLLPYITTMIASADLRALMPTITTKGSAQCLHAPQWTMLPPLSGGQYTNLRSIMPCRAPSQALYIMTQRHDTSGQLCSIASPPDAPVS